MWFSDFWYNLVRHLLRNFQGHLMLRNFFRNFFSYLIGEKNSNFQSNPYLKTQKNLSGYKNPQKCPYFDEPLSNYSFSWPSCKKQVNFHKLKFLDSHTEFWFFQLFRDFGTIEHRNFLIGNWHTHSNYQSSFRTW